MSLPTITKLELRYKKWQIFKIRRSVFTITPFFGWWWQLFFLLYYNILYSYPILLWTLFELQEFVDYCNLGFPGDSASKESTCNVGDLGSIPGWEVPLEKGMSTHSRILAWRIPWTVYSPWDRKELDTTKWLSLTN